MEPISAYQPTNNGFNVTTTHTSHVSKIGIIIDRNTNRIVYHGEQESISRVYDQLIECLSIEDFHYDIVESDHINIPVLNACLAHEPMLAHLISKNGYERAYDMLTH